MTTIWVAFDIDGTLRCSCSDTCRRVNEDVLQVAQLHQKMKNTILLAWSGGGAAYAQAFIDSDPRLQEVFGDRCFSKIQYKLQHMPPDLAYDDEEEFAMGLVNVIVNPIGHD